MAYPPAFLYCLKQNVLIKFKCSVPFKAGLYIMPAWNSKRSVLMHDVHIDLSFPNLSCSDSDNRQFHFCLVVKGWKSLVPVKGCLVRLCGFPHGHGNALPLLWFDCQIRTRLAPLKKEFIIRQDSRSDNPC